MTDTQIAIALHQCIGEHVSVYLVPNGQHGLFLRLSGPLDVAGRQVKGHTMSTRRYSLGAVGSCISFTPRDVLGFSDNNTCIHIKS